MGILEAILLGVLQGLTEFLPVSSSGHLALAEKLLGFSGEEFVAFDVLVHLATAAAILVVLIREILRVLLADRRVILTLIIASIPAVFAGVFLESSMSDIKDNLIVVGAAFIGTAFMLVLARIGGKDKKGMREMGALDAIAVGVNQAFAILPGLSRSGLTISSARFCGIRPRDAFTFSFLLGLIAILGASAFKAKDISALSTGLGIEVLTAAFVSAFVSGLIALIIFRRIVIAGKLHYFAWYLVPLGLWTIILDFLL
jgi:undecaprenyl-diphosphatase